MAAQTIDLTIANYNEENPGKSKKILLYIFHEHALDMSWQ